MLAFWIDKLEPLLVWRGAIDAVKFGRHLAATKNQERTACRRRRGVRSERAPIKKRRWDENQKTAQDREAAWLHGVIVGSRDVNHEGADPKRTKQCQNMFRRIGQSARFRSGTVPPNDEESLDDYRNLNDLNDGKLKRPGESGVIP